MSDDYDNKMGMYNRGERTLEEITKPVVPGNHDALKTVPLGKIKGFTEKGKGKVRSVVTYLGYSPEEIKSPEFQEYIDKVTSDFYKMFDKDLFEIGHLIPDTDISVGIRQLESFILPEMKEVITFRERLNEAFGFVDLIELQVNPVAVGRSYFGAGGDDDDLGWRSSMSMSPGPEIDDEGKWVTLCPAAAHHERFHNMSYLMMRSNHAEIDDGYFKEYSSDEMDRIKNGNHSEVFMEDLENPGKPVKSTSVVMQRAIERSNPEFVDTGVIFEDKDGEQHKILTPNPYPHIMKEACYLEHEEHDKLLAADVHFITDFQRTLAEEMAKEYLIAEGRMEPEQASLIGKVIESKTLMTKDEKRSHVERVRQGHQENQDMILER